MGAPLSSRRVASPKLGHGRVHPHLKVAPGHAGKPTRPRGRPTLVVGLRTPISSFLATPNGPDGVLHLPHGKSVGSAGRLVGGAPPAAIRFASPKCGHGWCTPPRSFPRDVPASRHVPGEASRCTDSAHHEVPTSTNDPGERSAGRRAPSRPPGSRRPGEVHLECADALCDPRPWDSATGVAYKKKSEGPPPQAGWSAPSGVAKKMK